MYNLNKERQIPAHSSLSNSGCDNSKNQVVCFKGNSVVCARLSAVRGRSIYVYSSFLCIALLNSVLFYFSWEISFLSLWLLAPSFSFFFVFSLFNFFPCLLPSFFILPIPPSLFSSVMSHYHNVIFAHFINHAFPSSWNSAEVMICVFAWLKDPTPSHTTLYAPRNHKRVSRASSIVRVGETSTWK